MEQDEAAEGGRFNRMAFHRNRGTAWDVCTDLEVQIPVRESVLYIDSPDVLDHIRYTADSRKLRACLKSLLSPSSGEQSMKEDESDREVLTGPSGGLTQIQQEQNRVRLEEFIQILEEVTGGHLQFTAVHRLQFVPDRGTRNVELTNLSSGVKALSVLAFAMESGCLDERTVLLLDEPETNLHPQWQLKYAEILVRLQRALHLKLMITTKSPYFMEAIELYSQKYGVRDNCSWYLADHQDGKITVQNVTADTQPIYATFAKPFEELEREEMSVEEESD